MTEKLCFKCGETKSIDQFHRHKGMKDGHLNKCSSCTVNDVRAWREHKGKKEERAQRYLRELELEKRTRKQTQKEISAGKASDEENKAKKRDYYVRNKHVLIPKIRQREKLNPRSKSKYRLKRYHTDSAYKLSICLRARMRNALKGNKSAASIQLIGCSIEDLKTYITGKFQEGMSWDNYGKWHIDHIKPFASFDLTEAAQQRAACHYTNLQPLWAADNLKKGCR